jgi:PfaD family protein
LAEEIIAEADSGGHTDNRPAILLVPNLRHLLEQTLQRYQYRHQAPRIGAAGGIGTPQSVLAAFALGADFVMTGSINQSCVEASTSNKVKELLCQASMNDVANAPAADMFEMGAKVQVLTRGSMFHTRANNLFELFKRYSSIDEISAPLKSQLEKSIFRKSLTDIWQETRDYFAQTDPFMLKKAEKNAKTKMALIFRWYLAKSIEWAQMEFLERKTDFQIMCGPSMGAFNQWVRNTPLEGPENRRVVNLAICLMGGALYLKRVQSILQQGVPLPKELMHVSPGVGVQSPPVLL